MARIELRVEEGWQSENSPPGTIEEFNLTEWKKSVGDRVEKWDILFIYNPGKVDIEYTSSVSGVLAEILIPSGSEGNPRGAVAGIIETEG